MLHIEEVHNLYSSPDIIRQVKANEDYGALVRNLTNAKDKKDRSMYEELLKKLDTTVEFVLDLGLMWDAFQGLS
jgi:hypothetical protein